MKKLGEELKKRRVIIDRQFDTAHDAFLLSHSKTVNEGIVSGSSCQGCESLRGLIKLRFRLSPVLKKKSKIYRNVMTSFVTRLSRLGFRTQ